MPAQQGDSDGRSRRPRASTNSFVGRFANWPKKSDPAPSTTHVTPASSLSIESLLDALTPPAVPSLSHARSLAGAIAAQTQILPPASLSPIIATLCAAESPPAFQAAGYDVMAAYCEYGGASLLTLPDKLAYFSLITLSPHWVMELWESRLKALQQLTLTDTLGTEVQLLSLLRTWMQECFDGLLLLDGTWEERERGLDNLSMFLGSLLGNYEFLARIPDAEVTLILTSLQSLVTRALPHPPEVLPASMPGSPLKEATSASASRSPSHRRQASSTSSASPFASITPRYPRNALALAANVYLMHLKTFLLALSPGCLRTILPTLFRILAYSSVPLLQPATAPHQASPSSVEYKVSQRISELLQGPHAATCSQILKASLSPSDDYTSDPVASAQLSIGAMRTLRNLVRQSLEDRVAQDATSSWAFAGLGQLLGESIQMWVRLDLIDARHVDNFLELRERVLEEATGMLRDVVLAWDGMAEEEACDEEEAEAVGQVLTQLVEFVKPISNHIGQPYLLNLVQPSLEHNILLRGLCFLLSRDEARHAIHPRLSVILVPVIDHLTDADSSRIPALLTSQNALSPTAPDWLDNWTAVLASNSIFAPARPLTQRALVEAIQMVQSLVHDMPVYRRDLIDLVYGFWKRQTAEDLDEGEAAAAVWALLSEEVVLRVVEEGEGSEGTASSDRSDDATVAGHEDGGSTSVDAAAAQSIPHASNVFVEDILELMATIASSATDLVEDDATSGSLSPDATLSPPPPLPPLPPSGSTSSSGSPALSRLGTEFASLRGSEQAVLHTPLTAQNTPLMSLLANLRNHADRTPSQPLPPIDDPTPAPPTTATFTAEPETPRFPRGVLSVASLISVFLQLSLTPFSLSQSHLDRAVRIWDTLLHILATSTSAHVKLAVLQFAMRLRADRDHAIYIVDTDGGLDIEGHIAYLAGWAHRTKESASLLSSPSPADPARQRSDDADDLRQPRSRVVHVAERDGRRVSRTRGGRSAQPTSSRSQSRAPSSFPAPPILIRVKPPPEPIWSFPDVIPFPIPATEQPSEGLITYDPIGPDRRVVLPLSDYVSTIVNILKNEPSWEVLSYVLCYLPTQLANKHFFCGPKSKDAIRELLSVLCNGVAQGTLGSNIEGWPAILKARDAQGMATHTLSVLISYRRLFDLASQHDLVAALLAGLGGDKRTVSCCLSALSIAAFDLQASTTKYMSHILEKLSHITSNAEMTVHIINFLALAGSSRRLYANFTTDDFKMVFGVALQYLQHHNDPSMTENTSWTLSQHVLIMSYYIVYVWFLALKMPDRKQHVPYISRQLLLANEGKLEVDEATEVCFDWIARYTYGSGDPRPSPSLLGDIVMKSGESSSEEPAIEEKSWLVGNSVVTIRSLVKRGWMEIVSRRPSGLTKFLCKTENVPIVGPGDVDPDMISVPATLMMDRDDSQTQDALPATTGGDAPEPPGNGAEKDDVDQIFQSNPGAEVEQPDDPDDVRGYVWSGVAPSQRRKDVSIDPSYFALQLSSYPSATTHSARGQLVTDKAALDRFTRSLDRIPVIDTHKVGIMYVAPGQTTEKEILSNTHGSPAYTRFLEGIGRLIRIRGQHDVYIGGMDPEEDGEYAFAWWDDIGQVLYHTATMMPSRPEDENFTSKKRHIGNDYVRIVWNDSGLPYRFDTLETQFQFVNIVIEPHSLGTIGAYSNDDHENEFFKVTVQRAPGMIDFTPIGHFKLVSANSLPLLMRQLSLLADWFADIFALTQHDTARSEKTTHWRARLQAIKRFRSNMPPMEKREPMEGVMGQQLYRDFTPNY